MGASDSDKEEDCKELKLFDRFGSSFLKTANHESENNTLTFLLKPITRLQFSAVKYLCNLWPNTCKTNYILTSLSFILCLQNNR